MVLGWMQNDVFISDFCRISGPKNPSVNKMNTVGVGGAGEQLHSRKKGTHSFRSLENFWLNTVGELALLQECPSDFICFRNLYEQERLSGPRTFLSVCKWDRRLHVSRLAEGALVQPVGGGIGLGVLSGSLQTSEGCQWSGMGMGFWCGQMLGAGPRSVSSSAPAREEGARQGCFHERTPA